MFYHSPCCINFRTKFFFIYLVALNVYMSLGELRYEIKALLLLLLFNQVGSTCAIIMFSVSFLIAG